LRELLAVELAGLAAAAGPELSLPMVLVIPVVDVEFKVLEVVAAADLSLVDDDDALSAC
jgi:hypothetical protein